MIDAWYYEALIIWIWGWVKDVSLFPYSELMTDELARTFVVESAFMIQQTNIIDNSMVREFIRFFAVSSYNDMLSLLLVQEVV